VAQTISDEPTLRVPASLRVVGRTGVAQGCATVGGSALVYARGRECSLFTTYLSDIGNTPGGPQVVFNSGILFSAPVRYVFLVLLGAQWVHRGASATFRQVALALGVLVVASTIGMAAIPFSLHLTAHKMSALVYLFGVVVLQSLIAVQERRCGLPRLLAASTVAVVVIYVVFATLLSLVSKVEAITRSTPVIWEWLAFVAIMLWLIVDSILLGDGRATRVEASHGRIAGV
jgi:hypothetical protein